MMSRVNAAAFALSGLIALFVMGGFIGCAGTAPGGTAGTSGGGGLPWSGGGLKVGYVRSDVIMERYPEYRDVDNKLRSENEDWLAETDKMETNILRMESDLEELRLILTPEQKDKRDQELVQARKDLQKYRQDTWYDENSRYIKRRNELLEPVNARVNDAIWKVAEDKGLDIVFDTVAGNIVYVKPAFDITDLVLEELQR
jgi:outer membrane protein